MWTTAAWLSALALAAATAACGGSDGSFTGNHPITVDGFAVLDAWTRPTPPTADEAAVYITIENDDAPDDRLIGASADWCSVMLPHVTDITDDVARMSEADDDQLGLRRGERVEMEPNGLHLMCMGLADQLDEGDQVSVQLEFSEHDPIVVPVRIEQR